ncbi:MAG: hypothetical protein WCF94_01665 [bacterium]
MKSTIIKFVIAIAVFFLVASFISSCFTKPENFEKLVKDEADRYLRLDTVRNTERINALKGAGPRYGKVISDPIEKPELEGLSFYKVQMDDSTVCFTVLMPKGVKKGDAVKLTTFMTSRSDNFTEYMTVATPKK